MDQRLKVDSLVELSVFTDPCAAAAHGSATFVQESVDPFRFNNGVGLSPFVSLIQLREQQSKPIYFCEKIWGVILLIGIRGPSPRAANLGAIDNFVTRPCGQI